MKSHTKFAGVLIIVLTVFVFACTSNEKLNPKNAKISLEDSLKKQISLYPDSLIAKENLLQFYRDSGFYDIAIKTNLDFISNDSFNARLHHIHGMLLLENEDTLNALTYFSKAYNLFNNPFDLAYAGAIYARKGNKNALICADTLLNMYRQKSAKEAWLIRGIYYAANNLSEKALPCFDSAIQIRFSFIEAYLEKAQTFKKLNRFREAVETLEQAITINNNLPEAYYIIGECFEKLHQNDSAIEAYEKTLMYDRNNEVAKEALKRMNPH